MLMPYLLYDLKEEGRHGTDLVEVTDGRANVLVSGLEEGVELNRLLGDEHANGGKHSCCDEK